MTHEVKGSVVLWLPWALMAESYVANCACVSCASSLLFLDIYLRWKLE